MSPTAKSFRFQKAQSVLEYTVLIAAVAAALVIMTDYIRKSLGAQTRAIEVELNGATTN